MIAKDLAVAYLDWLVTSDSYELPPLCYPWRLIASTAEQRMFNGMRDGMPFGCREHLRLWVIAHDINSILGDLARNEKSPAISD